MPCSNANLRGYSPKHTYPHENDAHKTRKIQDHSGYSMIMDTGIHTGKDLPRWEILNKEEEE
jgi:hypothetical protein